MKMKFIKGIVSAAVLSLFVACGSSSGDDNEIVFWHSMGGPQKVTLDKLVEEYNSTVGQKEGYKIVPVYQGKNYELSKKFKAVVQARDIKSYPDLTLMSAAETGNIAGIDEVVKAEDVLSSGAIGLTKDDFKPNIVDSLSVKNKMIGLPFAPSCILLYYNKDAFAEVGLDPERAPKTLKELGEYSAKLLIKDGDRVTRYGYANMVDGWAVGSWIEQQNTDGKGYSLFGDNDNGRSGTMTRVLFDENGTMKTFLQAYKDANEVGTFNYKENDPVNNFAGGNNTMILASAASMTTVFEAVGDKFKVGVAMLPAVNETATGGVTFGGSAIYPIDRGNKKKLARVYDFLKFIYTDKSQVAWSAGTGYLPSTKSSYESQDYKDLVIAHPEYLVPGQALNNSNPHVQEPLNGVVIETLTINKNGVLNVLDGSMTVDESVKYQADEINNGLKAYNEANESK